MEPYALTVRPTGDGRYAIEVRPRAGTWSPFFAAVPLKNKDVLDPIMMHGPRGFVPTGSVLANSGETQSADGQSWIMYANNEATPTQSYFVFCNQLPTRLGFGVKGDPDQQYTVHLASRTERSVEE